MSIVSHWQDRATTAAISAVVIAASSYFGFAQPAIQGEATARQTNGLLELKLEAERQELIEHAANGASIRQALESCNQSNRDLLSKLTRCLEGCRS